jgi:hypothetical protein
MRLAKILLVNPLRTGIMVFCCFYHHLPTQSSDLWRFHAAAPLEHRTGCIVLALGIKAAYLLTTPMGVLKNEVELILKTESESKETQSADLS